MATADKEVAVGAPDFVAPSSLLSTNVAVGTVMALTLAPAAVLANTDGVLTMLFCGISNQTAAQQQAQPTSVGNPSTRQPVPTWQTQNRSFSHSRGKSALPQSPLKLAR